MRKGAVEKRSQDPLPMQWIQWFLNIKNWIWKMILILEIDS